MPISEVHNEDCMAGMSRYPDKFWDLAIVDPPYGYRQEGTAILNFRMESGEKNWNVAPTPDYFKELKRVSKNQIVWGGNYFPELWGEGCRGFIFWHKANPVPNFADGELAYTSFDVNARMFDYRYYGNIEGKSAAVAKFHPTQKPIDLYRWILTNYADEGNKILDTHMGSQSSRIAAFNMGFDYWGWEIDKEYFDKGNQRFKEQTAQIQLF
jgi:site-specific DNA-methyltransferase (adenine-specific)